jgi:hypothetical protein
MKAAFTICSANYLGQALTLKSSFARLHQDVDFFIVVVDRKSQRTLPDLGDAKIVWAEDLGIELYWRHAFKFDVIEWSTNVKPFAAKYFLNTYEKVLYLDPDLYFYRNVDWLFEELETCDAIVTPHATTPICDEHTQGDLEWMRVGTFNLGFIGLSRGPDASKLLDWWGSRCISDGYIETQRGLFVDQKWLTLAVGFFPGIRILFHHGLNVSSWNLHERQFILGADPPELSHGISVYFFHFSGFDPLRPGLIHTRQKRWAAKNRPDIEPLLSDYSARLLGNDFDKYKTLSYTNDRFSNGELIAPLLRRIYALHFEAFSDDDPFSSTSDVYRYALRNHLLQRESKQSKRTTADDLAAHGFEVRLINILLRIVARIVGPRRYFNLMKYAAYISSIRSQYGVFKPPQS